MITLGLFGLAVWLLERWERALLAASGGERQSPKPKPGSPSILLDEYVANESALFDEALANYRKRMHARRGLIFSLNGGGDSDGDHEDGALSPP